MSTFLATTLVLVPLTQPYSVPGVCDERACANAESRLGGCQAGFVLRAGPVVAKCRRQQVAKCKRCGRQAAGSMSPHGCSWCGVSTQVHMLERKQLEVAFPNRDSPSLCALAGERPGDPHWPTVSRMHDGEFAPTISSRGAWSAESGEDRRVFARAWLMDWLAQPTCEILRAGSSRQQQQQLSPTGGLKMYSRFFSQGIRGFRGLRGLNGSVVDVKTLHDTVIGGMNNLILGGLASERRPGSDRATFPRSDVRIRLRVSNDIGRSWRGDEPKSKDRLPPWRRSALVACSEDGSCLAARERACHSLSKGQGTPAISDTLSTLQLQGTPGWPRLHSLPACCTYAHNGSLVEAILTDLRQPLLRQPIDRAMGSYSSGSVRARVRARKGVLKPHRAVGDVLQRKNQHDHGRTVADVRMERRSLHGRRLSGTSTDTSAPAISTRALLQALQDLDGSREVSAGPRRLQLRAEPNLRLEMLSDCRAREYVETTIEPIDSRRRLLMTAGTFPVGTLRGSAPCALRYSRRS